MSGVAAEAMAAVLPDALPLALRAACLLAVDPGLGGMSVRALPGPVRDRFLAHVRGYWPAPAPWRRVPLHIGDDRLLGGLDLAATLQARRAVAARGLLAEADGGMLLLAMAERVPAATVARLCQTLDAGAVAAERDGIVQRSATRFAILALDEGVTGDERPATALLDRLAFLIDLTPVSLADITAATSAGALPTPVLIEQARRRLASVVMPDEALAALCGAADALGVAALRALLQAARAARAAAALADRDAVTPADIALACQLVLAPRATLIPGDAPEPAEAAPPPPAEGAPAEAPPETDDAGADQPPDPPTAPDAASLQDMVLAAARAAIPADLLTRLLAGQTSRDRAQSNTGAGALAASLRRGRPAGVRAGRPGGGVRLSLIDTLRAAAPWQSLRRRDQGRVAGVIVTPDDFRITRFKQRTGTTTIFVVDASGSAALARLAEAKGAVELVLADCYVRRDRVALIAFRGTAAELLLPPTTSLVRAKRCLAGLPGGGGTPLARGLDEAVTLADAVRRRGDTATLILLSDGRANVARDGTPGRPQATADALEAARRVRAAGIAAVVVDTSPRPAPDARQIATEMGARYVPLPYAGAEAVALAARRA